MNDISRLDELKPLLSEEYLFPIEPISEPLESFSSINEFLQKTASSLEGEATFELSNAEKLKLRRELNRMKVELQEKQQVYQEQFDKLTEWITFSFSVENPQILIDHQEKAKEEELAAEEAAAQGNSKQHQRIRTLSSSLNKSSTSIDGGDGCSEFGSVSETSLLQSPSSQQAAKSTTQSTSSSMPPVRSSKNLSRMGQNTVTSGGIGQGQKDLSSFKSKIPNQIPINVFWNYIEPFFKPIDEDDLKYLDDPSRILDVAPFVIPPLGLHYEAIWYEQYGYIVPGSESKKRAARELSDTSGKATIHIRDRLLSALIDSEANVNLDDFDSSAAMIDEPDLMMDDYAPVPLDDRIRKSLNEMGFTELSGTKDYKEDDEICVEMRSVQRQLREQIVINQYRKKRLAEFIRSKLSAQEFYALIDDIDKQIDGIFQKRLKNAKKSKKKGTPVAAVGSSSAATSTASAVAGHQPGENFEIAPEALQCLENRQRLLKAFAHLMPDRIEAMCPSSLVDFDPHVEDEISLNSRKSAQWLPLPEIPLKQPLSCCQPAFPSVRDA